MKKHTGKSAVSGFQALKPRFRYSWTKFLFPCRIAQGIFRMTVDPYGISQSNLEHQVLISGIGPIGGGGVPFHLVNIGPQGVHSGNYRVPVIGGNR